MEGAKAARHVSENDDQVSNLGSGFRDAGEEEDDDYDWEEGETWENGTNDENEENSGKEWNGEVSLSVNEEEGNAVGAKNGTLKRKSSTQRRATAQDKEFAEMVHKAHLLCLLAHGRIVDAACNDPLLQASILSLVPPSVGPSVDANSAAPTTKALGSLVSWFMKSFRVMTDGEGSSSSSNQGFSSDDFAMRLRRTIEKQAGSAEEVAALAVVLLRSLGFMTRYVTILDVASLKPDADSLEASGEMGSRNLHEKRTVFSSDGDLEIRKVASLAQILAHSVPQQVNGTRRGFSLNSDRGSPSAGGAAVQDSKPAPRGRGKAKGAGRGQGKTRSASGSREGPQLAHEPEGELSNQKRGGDDEFERQLAMAIAATAAVAEAEVKKLPPKTETSGSNGSDTLQPHSSDAKRSKRIKGLGNNGNASLRQKLGLSPKQEGLGSNGGAVWSRKLGPVMHWAEVYCNGDGIEGRWVHVDAARGIVDGADKIEGAAAACRLPLRYVVAFAGSGAKDVTRRYVTLWFKIDRLRVDQDWWEATLNPLKQLEAAATAEPSSQAERATEGRSGLASTSARGNILEGDRSALEDMEMETKTFTEPLPTSQQAYKSHHLFVIEKWLTKYQTLYPKGPVLGYCAGHPVYPRACVQVLHTPDYWLREGFKVKSGESPVKLVKASRFAAKKEVDSADLELDGKEEKEEKMTELYGKWQTDPWQPPRAVDGIVPRNERGQVDVWSEKCIPPGTVHLRFPGLVPIVQKLGINFAPAMVGFENRKGRTYPVYDGIVICEEFKDLILDAHRAQEEARLSELLRKEEEAAAKRQRHLLRSMVTRQRLETAYEGTKAGTTEPEPIETITSSNSLPMAEAIRSAADGAQSVDSQSNLSNKKGKKRAQKQSKGIQSPHVHQFPEEDQTYDEDTGIRTKLCACGFTYYVEDM